MAENQQSGGVSDGDEKTALLHRKDRAQRPTLLKDALEAVDAALGGGRVSNRADIQNQQSGSGHADAIEAALHSQSNNQSDHQLHAMRAGAGLNQLQSSQIKTQRVRGRQRVTQTQFFQEPVVGWLVVVGGPGLGAFRAIFEGNNSIGWAPSQQIQINFGDDAISAEEQAFLRYDSDDKKFLFVPNMSKTNVVWVNEEKPTSAVELKAMDVITMGRTRLVFVPFCGEEFDWADLKE